MKSEELIPTSWFYRKDDEKIKLNWFLYEYACSFFEHLENDNTKRIKDWKAKHTDKQIAEFCAYYAKRMSESYLNHLETGSNTVRIYENYFTDYCHANTMRENQALAKVGGIAWNDLMECCNVCPVNCIGGLEEYCEFFDESENSECLS